MKKYLDSLISAIKDAVSVLKLDKSMISRVAADDSATLNAIFILALPFVVNVLLLALTGPMFLWLQIKILLIPIVALIGAIFSMSLVAQVLFKAKGDHLAFFRVLAYASIVSWLGVLPVLLGAFGMDSFYNLFNLVNLVLGVWILVVTYNVLTSYYRLNQQNAIITMIIGVVCAAILQSLLGELLIGRFYRVMYF
ncbi:hypothetical protein HOF67_00110 [Candidatus Peregrinibacteria bacterium]|jgi:hypothetical protein|nr:hypothetical protein [Candidatus Peregrinibacteria bacterium]